MAVSPPADGDDGFFTELLSQFGEAPLEEEEGDAELASFLDRIERGSTEHEEAEVLSVLEGMPNLDESAGSLVAPPLKGAEQGGDDADEILAAFADGRRSGKATATAADLLRHDDETFDEPPEHKGDTQAPDLPSRAQPPPARAPQGQSPSMSRPPATPAPRPAIGEDPTAPSGLTLRDLFGFEFTEDLALPPVSAPEDRPFDDALAPRKAFATKRLHQFFIRYIDGQPKFAILRYLMVTGLDQLAPTELEEALIVPEAQLLGPLEEMVSDGLLIHDKGRYSLNSRSRNVLLMASLVTGWQDPERREEIWAWLRDA